MAAENTVSEYKPNDIEKFGIRMPKINKQFAPLKQFRF